MTWSNYFELRWGTNSDTWATPRRYRMEAVDAGHLGERNLTGISNNLWGQLMVVRVDFWPRQVQGIVRLSELNEIVSPWGTRAELKAATRAADLEAKLWDDADFWKAVFVVDWTPMHLDPMGKQWRFPFSLLQKE